MRVLMVNDYPVERGWGAERHIERLIDGLRGVGDEVSVFTARAPHRGAGRVFDLWDPGARRRLHQEIARWRPDVVNYHNVQRELSASVFDAGPRLARVLSVHDHRLFGVPEGRGTGAGGTTTALKRAKAVFERSRARRAMDAVTAPSADLVGRLRRDGFREVTLVRYFVDAGPDPMTTPSASEDIVFVGRVDADKGVRELATSFDRLAAKHPRARLLIGGDGEERARVPSLVSAAARERVQTLGRLTPPEVRALLERARVVCVPSLKREGAPIVAVEAAMAGRPVVVSDDPGLAELVTEARFGTVTPRGDVSALTAGLDALLADPGRADELGARARAHAVAHWTPDAGVATTREVYGRAIARAALH